MTEMNNRLPALLIIIRRMTKTSLTAICFSSNWTNVLFDQTVRSSPQKPIGVTRSAPVHFDVNACYANKSSSLHPPRERVYGPHGAYVWGTLTHKATEQPASRPHHTNSSSFHLENRWTFNSQRGEGERRWEEGWEEEEEEEEKVKIAADKKEEVNIKERRKNRDKRCEIDGGGETEQKEGREKREPGVIEKRYWFVPHWFQGAEIDVEASSGLHFCSSVSFLPPPTTPFLRDHHRDAGGVVWP